MVEILNYNNDQLSSLLSMYERHLEFEDMMYILAVEDYTIFHNFMYEAYQAKTEGQFGFVHRIKQGRASGSTKQVTEEELIQ